MTNIQKTIIGAMILIIIIMVAMNVFIFNKIKQHGGVKSVIIEAGKEVKDINREINKN